MITENAQNWSSIITEELGVKDQNKINWMSRYAQFHEVYEGLDSGAAGQGIYTTPLNTLGMGNPQMPDGVGFAQGTGIGDTGKDFHNPLYKTGSGDIPMSTLPMALEIAAMTIGLELVPVVQANGPWAMLSYMDFPYAGGKLGRINETALDGKGEGADNKPIYIKVLGINVDAATKTAQAAQFVAGTAVTVGAFHGKFIGFSRIDNTIIAEVVSVDQASGADQSIAEAFAAATSVTVGTWTSATVTAGNLKADLVAGMADHVQGFSNFFDGSKEPMTRAQNETGVGNTIGARMFSKLVQMGSYEVTGSVTRQQLQDMPLYGVDVIGKVLEAMQNQISQEINNRILDRLFKLGVENWKTQKDYQNVDLNLYLGQTPSGKAFNTFPSYNKFVDLNGNTMTSYTVPLAIQNSSAENVHTHQRRVMSRCLAAANLIANVSRYGRGTFVVTNTQILSALQDCAGFVVAPMQNDLVQDGSRSIYFAGNVAGLNIYVDPYMTWDDTRVLVGRKSDGNNPGVIFMPYILADTVQITAEGTMAPKLLINSRFAIVDAGFHPAQSYYCFAIDTDNNAFLI